MLQKFFKPIQIFFLIAFIFIFISFDLNFVFLPFLTGIFLAVVIKYKTKKENENDLVILPLFVLGFCLFFSLITIKINGLTSLLVLILGFILGFL